MLHILMIQNGDTPISRAARDGQGAMVTLLLDRGANIDLADKVDALPVMIVLLSTCLGGK